MDLPLVTHILAGGLSIGSGFIALYAGKGSSLHRRAGMVFVFVMLTMTSTGFVLAIARNADPVMNVPAALITAYLVLTALTTLRAPSTGTRRVQIVAMLVALGVGVVTLVFGFEALARGGMRDDIPAFPFLLFGLIGVLGAVGDLRMIRSGTLRPLARVGRHLWRMSLALFIATMSFFLGQADEIPETLRIPPLLALPIVAVLVTMLYWLWRVRIRQNFRGGVRDAANEAA